jgi:lipid II:glycine glycyltransferase (peptidoglycan interpeptide bridge formation enzyme)
VAAEPTFGLLQSWEWGDFKEKLGWMVFRIAAVERGHIVAGAQMLMKSLPLGSASVAYIPRGPLGNWLAEDIGPRLLTELHRVARRHGAVFLKIEPPLANDPALARRVREIGFRLAGNSNQPRATIILNLDQDLDAILKRMRQKNRQYIRAAEREGITVRAGRQEDLPAFTDLMERTSQREHLPSRIREYYEHEWRIFSEKKQAVLLMAFRQDRLLAVRALFCFGKNAAEFHAGSSDEARHFHPNYLLVWEGIKWAKERGCSTYDFWGIPDDICETPPGRRDPVPLDRTDGLWGVYRFKSGFCSDVSCYLGSYDHVYRPVAYALVMNAVARKKPWERVAAFMDKFSHP